MPVTAKELPHSVRNAGGTADLLFICPSCFYGAVFLWAQPTPTLPPIDAIITAFQSKTAAAELSSFPFVEFGHSPLPSYRLSTLTTSCQSKTAGHIISYDKKYTTVYTVLVLTFFRASGRNKYVCKMGRFRYCEYRKMLYDPGYDDG